MIPLEQDVIQTQTPALPRERPRKGGIVFRFFWYLLLLLLLFLFSYAPERGFRYWGL